MDKQCLISTDHLKEPISNISVKHPWNSETDFEKQLKHFRPFQALGLGMQRLKGMKYTN